MQQVKVSVIVPVYNRKRTIKRCINSILSQTMPPFEVIVVDDGSTDKTIELIENISDKIRIIKQNHRGAQAARNLGIINAKGDYIAFLDSDDKWLPNLLEVEINQLLKYKDDYFIYSDCYVHENGKLRLWKLPESNTYVSLLMQSGPMFQSMIAKKELFYKIGLLDENVVSFQEWDTAIQLAKVSEGIHVHRPLFVYYLHDSETISKDKSKYIKGYEYILNKNQKEIIKEHGIQAIKFHYMHLIKQCIKNRDKRWIVFAFDILFVNILYITEIVKQGHLRLSKDNGYKR